MNHSISLTVNGVRRDIELDDPRVTLLDLLRERLRPDRNQEGLRPRPMRRLHDPGRRPADQFLPRSGRQP